MTNPRNPQRTDHENETLNTRRDPQSSRPEGLANPARQRGDPHQSPREAGESGDVVTAKVSCPWCPDFDPTDPSHAGASHGMCSACRDLFIFNAMKRTPPPITPQKDA